MLVIVMLMEMAPHTAVSVCAEEAPPSYVVQM